MKLSGHLCSLVSVAFGAEHQLISLASDESIKVWDLRMHKVIQHISEKVHQPHPLPLSALAFDTQKHQIVVASSAPQGLVLQGSLHVQGNVYTGHYETVIGAAYNVDFDQAPNPNRDPSSSDSRSPVPGL